MNNWNTLSDDQIRIFKSSSIRFKTLTNKNEIDFFIKLIHNFFLYKFDVSLLTSHDDNVFLRNISTIFSGEIND